MFTLADFDPDHGEFQHFDVNSQQIYYKKTVTHDYRIRMYPPDVHY